ncbi:hypothetical protein A6A08_04985 [Nocardiopsis sp. TSRI0078]|uniref:hypothetical protein n=1 Tax=unclassified Nocardiopsis TaxID=2649073 RepID=UPI00093AC4CF|nr:hypothetical protein [Nocardiopsis sp. TSRI0078]OKI18969.1 hypothetical protein A6A08_04985 [Nocardiopsis sp. TSRI0078]
MAQAWMPGTDRLGGGTARTPPGIGAPRTVWTVTESDPGAWSAHKEARRMVDEGHPAHLVWNPLTGEVVQTLAATRRSRLALGGTHQYGLHLDHGHEGRVCLVVAAVASREAPFTDGPMHGLAPILAWLDSWGVERAWHAGPPGREGAKAGEAVRRWARGGHFGHDQVPGSSAKGPGRLDTARLLAAGPPVEGAPRAPRARPGTPRSATA